MYALYAPIQAAYKESQSLKEFAKMKYDKEHKDSLSKYPELKKRMQSLLENSFCIFAGSLFLFPQTKKVD